MFFLNNKTFTELWINQIFTVKCLITHERSVLDNIVELFSTYRHLITLCVTLQNKSTIHLIFKLLQFIHFLKPLLNVWDVIYFATLGVKSHFELIFKSFHLYFEWTQLIKMKVFNLNVFKIQITDGSLRNTWLNANNSSFWELWSIFTAGELSHDTFICSCVQSTTVVEHLNTNSRHFFQP